MGEITKSNITALTMTEDELLHVLENSLYPGAARESIKLVRSYCAAAGLDPLQKPVHIVPIWDTKAGRMRDVIMPGIGLYRTQASRTGQFAGMSEPEFGPDITTKIGGQEITYPEWCRVTVKRALTSGIVAEFTAREFWIENYAVKGGKEKSVAPNSMWTKRARGQLAKCTSAQALRIAFPELGAAPTAEEMEGKEIDMGSAVREEEPRIAKELPAYPDKQFITNLPVWQQLIADGKKTDQQIISMVSTKYTLSAAQMAAITAPVNVDTETGEWLDSYDNAEREMQP